MDHRVVVNFTHDLVAYWLIGHKQRQRAVLHDARLTPRVEEPVSQLRDTTSGCQAVT